MSVVWILPGATGTLFEFPGFSHLWHHPVDGAEGADKERFLQHLVGVDLGVKLQRWKKFPARPRPMEHEEYLPTGERWYSTPWSASVWAEMLEDHFCW